jgi:uncharacterized membrane protein YfcA
MDKLRLLPHIYKKIGIVLLIVSFPLAFLLSIYLNTEIKNPKFSRSILSLLVSIGFTLLIFSKEKIEDEFIEYCRLKAFAFSFLLGIAMFIIRGIFHFSDYNRTDSIFSILLLQCISYSSHFYFRKNNRYPDK